MGLFGFGRSRVLCPFCFGKLDLDNLEPVCSRHPQENITRKAKILKADGQGGILDTACSSCHKEEEAADCVRCNSNTPQGAEKCPAVIPFAAVDPTYNVYSLALIGLPKSGKTCYKLRLIDELGKKFKQPKSIKPYSRFTALNNNSKLPLPTSNSSNYAMPEFFALTDNGSKILLEIYDFSGEDVCRAAKDDGSNASIAISNTIFNADAIVFFIDPEQSFKDHLGNSAYKDLENYADMCSIIKSLLTKVQFGMTNAKTRKLDKIPPKIAYIFTKSDREYTRKAYEEFRNSWDILQTSPEIRNKESREIIENLIKKHDPRYGIIFDLPSFCNEENVRYFITSSLGFGFEKHEQTITKLGSPFRVLDLVL